MARAYGAARRAFDLVVDYAKERQQFGQAIGKFQAIQHKLANCLIALEGVRLTLDHAAHLHDRGDRELALFRQFGRCVRRRRVAAGFAGNPAYLRCHRLCRGTRGAASLQARASRYDRARRSAGMRGVALPRFCSIMAGRACRNMISVRPATRCASRRSAGWRDTGPATARRPIDAKPFSQREFDPEFALDIGKTGWIGLGWPKAFGGQARSPQEQLAFMETMERAEAPRIGAAIQANALDDVRHPASAAEISAGNSPRRGDAWHGLQRTSGGFRPRGTAHQRGA